MPRPANAPRAGNETPPQYWSRTISGEGGHVLTYAVRSGAGYATLLALGTALLLGGAWAVYWLIGDGGLTVAGIVFLLLLPGGAMLFGVYCLNIALWMRSEYLLGQHALSARSHSLFGDKRREVPRQAIEAINQAYSPPRQSESSHAQGDWVTLVAYRKADDGKLDEFPLDGKHTREEARWLGQVLSEWAGVPLKRGFGAEFEEADPAELPEP